MVSIDLLEIDLKWLKSIQIRQLGIFDKTILLTLQIHIYKNRILAVVALAKIIKNSKQKKTKKHLKQTKLWMEFARSKEK